MIKNLSVYSYYKFIDKRKVHSFIGWLKKALELNIQQLSINFINSEEIHKINREFLNHDYSTDIITFDYSDNSDVIDAELIISVEDAGQNAKKFKVNLNEELKRLIIHGILHLLGFDDKTRSEKIIMRKKENHLLKLNNFILLQSSLKPTINSFGKKRRKISGKN